MDNVFIPFPPETFPRAPEVAAKLGTKVLEQTKPNKAWRGLLAGPLPVKCQNTSQAQQS